MTATETNTTAIKHIIKLIHAAMEEWSGWDWDIEVTDKHGNVYLVNADMVDDRDLPREVREQAKEYHAEVMEAIDTCRANGQDAIDCLLNGDLEGALAALEAAADYESDYGASPAWGPPLEALEALMGVAS
jgi:hypothetical protein